MAPIRGKHIYKDSEDRGEMAQPRTGRRSQNAESKDGTGGGRMAPEETQEVGRSQMVRHGGGGER